MNIKTAFNVRTISLGKTVSATANRSTNTWHAGSNLLADVAQTVVIIAIINLVKLFL